MLENVEKILAIELLTAAQAFEYRKPLKSGKLLEQVHKAVRERVTFADKDRVFSDDIEKGILMIRNKVIVDIVEQAREKARISIATPYTEEFEYY